MKKVVRVKAIFTCLLQNASALTHQLDYLMLFLLTL